MRHLPAAEAASVQEARQDSTSSHVRRRAQRVSDLSSQVPDKDASSQASYDGTKCKEYTLFADAVDDSVVQRLDLMEAERVKQVSKDGGDCCMQRSLNCKAGPLRKVHRLCYRNRPRPIDDG